MSNYLLGLNSEVLDLQKDKEIFEMFNGVGMIRGENLCVSKMQYFTIPSFQHYVTEYLKDIAEKFKDKPVWYRTADLVPHQINLLEGADHILPDNNALLGLRGVRRDLEFINTYKFQLKAFCEAAKQHGNLGILLPFVSNINEVKTIQELLYKEFDYSGKLGVMLENPAICKQIKELHAMGIENFTIGMNDFTCFSLAAARGIPQYSMQDQGVKRLVQETIQTVHNEGLPVSMAGYLNKDVVDFYTHDGELQPDSFIIHYDAIPDVFDNLPEDKDYKKHYQAIKDNYNSIKEKSKEL